MSCHSSEMEMCSMPNCGLPRESTIGLEDASLLSLYLGEKHISQSKLHDGRMCAQCKHRMILQNILDELKKEHKHYMYWHNNKYIETSRYCQQCVEIRTLLYKASMCENCGNINDFRGRLCNYCTYNSRQCDNRCGKRCPIIFKMCIDCINSINAINACNLIGCDYECKKNNESKQNIYFCTNHTCGNTSCNNFNCRLKDGSKDGSKDGDFCEKCRCSYTSCINLKINEHSCEDHTCNHDTCNRQKCHSNYGMNGIPDYCEYHICKRDECQDIVFAPDTGKYKYCVQHLCKIRNCFKERRSESYCSCDYCEDHSCRIVTCNNKKYNDSDLCLYHECIYPKCIERKQTWDHFLCYKHSRSRSPYSMHEHSIREISITCSQEHNGSNHKKRCGIYSIKKTQGLQDDAMMYLCKIFVKIHDISIVKTSWFTLSNIKEVKDFYAGMRKNMHIILYGLKMNGVCKNLREMIFWLYLKTVVIHYFEKECYYCVRTCSESVCGAIAWPYSKNCRQHTCTHSNSHSNSIMTSLACDDILSNDNINKCGNVKYGDLGK